MKVIYWAMAVLLAGCTTARIQSLPIASEVASAKTFRDVAGCLVITMSKNRSFPVKTIEGPGSVTITQSIPVAFAYSVATVINVQEAQAGSHITLRTVGSKPDQPFPESLRPCL